MRLLQSNCEELERRRQTERSGESKQMAHSLKAVENMLKANGAVVFSGEKALLEVAKYLNTIEG